MADQDLSATLKNFFQGGNLLSLPTAQAFSLDTPALLHAVGVRRISDVRPKHVRDIAALNQLTESPEEFFSGAGTGAVIAAELRDSLQQTCQLWLFHADDDTRERLVAVFGAEQIYPVGTARDGLAPLAINPVRLAEAWSTPGADAARQRWLTEALSGIDTLRTPQRLVRQLRELGVPHRPRSALVRWLLNPAVFFYVVVLVYSSLRALPVMFLPGFHGDIWILWAIDMITAIPYTWGVVAMVTARTGGVRALGVLVTAVTFVAPYIYFWAYGRDYPHWVWLVVAALVIGGLAIEWFKIWSDRRITRGLLLTGRLVPDTSATR